jgi:ankyrin repeat protein
LPICAVYELQSGDLACEVAISLVQELGADVNLALRQPGIQDGATPLAEAACRGNPDTVRCLVYLGAHVDKADEFGTTALMVASKSKELAVVQCLVELGASVNLADSSNFTALHASAELGRYSTMEFLLEHAGANLDAVTIDGATLWDLLGGYLRRHVHLGAIESLTSLLRVMVLRGVPPDTLATLLSPENARVVYDGARLRAQLPAFLVVRRALLDENCPVLLSPLRALVHGYMELTTTEELWATGLGAAP